VRRRGDSIGVFTAKQLATNNNHKSSDIATDNDKTPASPNDSQRSISMAAVLRAFFGYLFLVMIVRIVGRRPGKQMTPFEFVLIFFMGGLALTAILGDEVSFTNALCQIITTGLAHYSIAWARSKSQRFARLVDGTPLILLEQHQWRADTLRHMRIQDDDVIASARESGIKTLQDVDHAVLERNGEISTIAARTDS
jgi:uncharacterized membrane protein YcaP (DUF421 family)